jgi:hypothetical protein
MKPHRSGFSLVLSLTVMASLVLMVVVLASFLQVESRLAQSQAGHQRAKLNALAAARIAIGQLQATMGPDQRVSMRADMFADDNNNPTGDTSPAVDNNPNRPAGRTVAHQKRYWTGVWATGGADNRNPRDWKVSDPHDTRLFLGWLTSPTLADPANPELIDDDSLNFYLPNRNNFAPDGKVAGGLNSDGQRLINGLSTTLVGDMVRLVGGSSSTLGQPSTGSILWPNSASTNSLQQFYGAIDLPKMPMPGPSMAQGGNLGANGSFAYWIGDEGIKAKINLPDLFATAGSIQLPGVTDWDMGFAGSAAQRSAVESVTPSLSPAHSAMMPAGFDLTFMALRGQDVTAVLNLAGGTWKDLGLARVGGRNELNAWANQRGGPAVGDRVSYANRLLWHDVTPWSYSVLSDTLNGGMKTDLSTAFELPYSVFRTLEVYPGQKETITPLFDRRQSFFHGAPNATFANGIAGDLDYNRPNLMDRIGSANEILRASPRAPEWAPRYLSNVSSIRTTVDLMLARNGNEMPERLGFAYEVPLSSRFFNRNRIDANTQGTAAGPAPSDVLTWPNIVADPALAENHADNWAARIVRGPTWDLYRNHYRLYKREIEAAAAADSSALRGQGAPDPTLPLGFIARGVEPLTYATGLRGLPERRSEPGLGDDLPPTNPKPDNFFSGGAPANNYFYRNNLADGGVGPDFLAQRRYRDPYPTSYKFTTTPGSGNRKTNSNQFTTYTAAALGRPSLATEIPSNAVRTDTRVASTRTWPTSPVLAPTILRFSTIYSGVRQGNNLGMTIDPVVVIHNPYDVALEFEGLAMVTNAGSSPFRFLFQLVTNVTSTEYLYKQAPWDPVPLSPPNNVLADRRITIGDVVVGGGDNDNRSMSFRIVAGSGGTMSAGGRVIRLEPGEIKVLSSANSSGGLVKSSDTNVSIPGDFGFSALGSKAFYKMTPFHNVRARVGSGDRSAERVLWTLDYDTCFAYAEYVRSDGFIVSNLNDKEFARRLRDLWERVQDQRLLHDAMVRSDGTPWDGSANSLNQIRPQAIDIVPRNSGWLDYNGFVVGAEGEIVRHGKGPDEIWGNANDTFTYENTINPYVAPSRRNGRIGMVGNQNWNFYLLGKKSIDGNANLNTHRRWFGTPDENASDYITAADGRRIKRFAEGTRTVGGFNCVDESLLLNFQAMTAGWPMYSNSNRDSAYFTVPDLLWTGLAGVQNPDFRIEGSTGITTPNGVRLDPFKRDPEFNDIEVTGEKADTLFNSEATALESGDGRKPVLMLDFVRRAADMTAQTDRWYPNAMNSSGFGMKIQAPTGSAQRGFNFRLQTPEEMRNAPMTPFFVSDRAQQAQLFGYDGKAHTPIGWIETQRSLRGNLGDANLPFAGDNAFWGTSIDDATGGLNRVVLYPVPRRPLLSLSQLGTVAFAEKNTDADFTVGSSFAHPGIGDLTRIVEWPGPRDIFPSESSLASEVRGPVPELGYVGKHMASLVLRNRSDVRTDHAFAANHALWDAYYFSGLNLQANSFSHRDRAPSNWPNGGDLPVDSTVENLQADGLVGAGLANRPEAKSLRDYKRALNEGRSLLANKRVVYVPDGKTSYTEAGDYQSNLRLPESEFPHPKYLARNSLYDGGFNVNSTSRAAWKAILGGLKGQKLPEAGNSAPGTALTKFARAFGPADKTGDNPWTSYRELDDRQIDALAGAIVQEVRMRGPFMSLADFVNRRLVNDDNFGLTGALQAAIDKAAVNGQSINNNAITNAGGTFRAPPSAMSVDPNTHLNGELLGAGWYTGGRINWWKQNNAYPRIPDNQRFPSLRAMGYNASNNRYDADRVVAGLGAPGIVTQMDVLNSIGPNLTARSDTFVVRAYGEARDEAGNIIGKAWVEVVVQRSTEYLAMTVGQRFPDYVEPNRRRLAYRVNTSAGREYDRQVLVETYEPAPPPTPPGSSALERTALLQEQRLNRILGRRFRPTSLRWLSPNEI